MKQKSVNKVDPTFGAEWQPTARDQHVLEVYSGFVSQSSARLIQNNEVVGIRLPPILEDDDE